jgi:hypothetical protein
LLEEEELDGIEEHIQEHGQVDNDGNALLDDEMEPEHKITT